jgi:hypothetical protein
MNRSLQMRMSSPAEQFRLAGRLAGLFAIVTWAAFVAYEYVRSGPPMFNAIVVNQAAALAVVFGGYLVGWRNELVGALLAVLGTIWFVVVCEISSDANPDALFFAVPGLLYLAAWSYDYRHSKTK